MVLEASKRAGPPVYDVAAYYVPRLPTGIVTGNRTKESTMAADTLRSRLTAVEAELGGLDNRVAELRAELDGMDDRKATFAASDAALAATDALGLPTPRPTVVSTRSNSRRSAPGPSRPKVTPALLVETLQGLGGTSTVESLVEALGLPDGRSLNGARRTAVDAGTIVYEDRTYRVA
jgi:hypothetical protein